MESRRLRLGGKQERGPRQAHNVSGSFGIGSSGTVPSSGNDFLNRAAEINLQTLLSGELQTMTVQTELM